jgi:hypothetical protein
VKSFLSLAILAALLAAPSFSEAALFRRRPRAFVARPRAVVVGRGPVRRIVVVRPRVGVFHPGAVVPRGVR